MLFSSSIDGGVGKLFQEDVRLAVEDLMALQDGSMANGLSQMTLSRTPRPRNIMPMV